VEGWIAMKDVRQVLTSTLMLLAVVAMTNGQDSKPEQNALPKTLTVKEVLSIIGKTEIAGQGCGGCRWNGEDWGYYGNMYKPMQLPWNTEPQKVEAGFAYGRMPVEHYLIEFSVPGFRYRRLTDVADLTLQPREEPK
jgi:hypothetical protein